MQVIFAFISGDYCVENISVTAKAILDARALYPDISLADLMRRYQELRDKRESFGGLSPQDDK